MLLSPKIRGSTFVYAKMFIRVNTLGSAQLTVNEIAYELGFEHFQSFSKLFKTKTNYSPLECRQSIN
jgi:transcriptional regulator GlxA family with amidase domain